MLHFVFMLCLLAPMQQVIARSIAVVGDKENSVHQRFFNGFTQQIQKNGSGLQVNFVGRESLGKTDASLVVSVGKKAAADLKNLTTGVPTINTLISKLEGGNLLNPVHGDAGHASIYIEQPPARIMSLVKTALPETESVTVALGENSRRFADEIEQACSDMGLKCTNVLIKDNAGIEAALEQAARTDRVLVVFPDSQVINANTAKSLILGAYLRRISLVGYSQALVKAGALMAVHSSPEQLGMDAANMALGTLGDVHGRLPMSRYPKLFSVSVNYQLARALRLDMQAESTLENNIKRAQQND